MMTYGLNHCAVEVLEQPKIDTVLEQYGEGTDDIRSGKNRQPDAAELWVIEQFVDNQGRRQGGAKWWAWITLEVRRFITCLIKQ